MTVLSALLVVATLQTDKTRTLGYTYAQILRMGETRWTDLYAKKQGDSTMAISSGFSLYGDALAWRNDRLLKGKKSPLRTHLEAFSSDVQGVGYALTGGGSMWYILDGQYHRDLERTLYRVLTQAGGAPRRVVSDVDKALDTLARAAAKIEDPAGRRDGRETMTKARRHFRVLVADASRLPRRDSDVVLEFCRSAALGVVEQAKGQ